MAMEMKSLEGVQYGTGATDELFARAYVMDGTVPVYTMVLERRHEMRIDLVCLDMYSTVDLVDVVMDTNALVNPFAVRQGMVLVYTDAASVDRLAYSRQELEDIRATLIDETKRHKTDPRRTTYAQRAKQIEAEKRALPPTVLKPGVFTTVDEDGYIKLRPGF